MPCVGSSREPRPCQHQQALRTKLTHRKSNASHIRKQYPHMNIILERDVIESGEDGIAKDWPELVPAGQCE